MLVLTRKPGEQLLIGTAITVTVLETQGNRIRLGIEAPAHVAVLRAELRSAADAPTWDDGGTSAVPGDVTLIPCRDR